MDGYARMFDSCIYHAPIPLPNNNEAASASESIIGQFRYYRIEQSN